MSINFASDVKQFQADQLISNLLENKSDLNKVEVSLLQKEKIEKEFFFGGYTQLDYRTVCFHKHRHTNLNAYLNIYSRESIFLLKGNSAIQFNY